MARRISRKELKRDEFVEATADATQWIEKNWAEVVKWAVAALLVVVVVLAWVQWNRSRAEAAATALAVAIDDYQAEQRTGFADTAALEALAKRFADVAAGSTASADAARFYAGATSYRLARHDDAVARLEPLANDAGLPDTLRASARVMLIEALAAAGETDRAREEMDAAIAADEPLLPASRVLLQMAAVLRANGEADGARAALQRVIDEFPDSPEAREARERLES